MSVCGYQDSNTLITEIEGKKIKIKITKMSPVFKENKKHIQVDDFFLFLSQNVSLLCLKSSNI